MEKYGFAGKLYEIRANLRAVEKRSVLARCVRNSCLGWGWVWATVWFNPCPVAWRCAQGNQKSETSNACATGSPKSNAKAQINWAKYQLSNKCIWPSAFKGNAMLTCECISNSLVFRALRLVRLYGCPAVRPGDAAARNQSAFRIRKCWEFCRISKHEFAACGCPNPNWRRHRNQSSLNYKRIFWRQWIIKISWQTLAGRSRSRRKCKIFSINLTPRFISNSKIRIYSFGRPKSERQPEPWPVPGPGLNSANSLLCWLLI